MTSVGPLLTALAASAGVHPAQLPTAVRDAAARARPLPVPPADDRDTWDRKRGTADHAAIDRLLGHAHRERGTAWPQPLASAAVRVHRDGDRDGWEQTHYARQHRLNRAAIAAAVTLEAAWVDEVADGVVLLCEQTSWCWPAHDDSRRRHGSVLAEVSEPFLDLGAGEAAGQLAWLDHLLGTQLDEHYPGLRARIRHEVRHRVLGPFLARRDWHWLGLDAPVHNWNPWIHGNVLVATLQLTDDPDERARLLTLALEGMDRYVAALPPDGAIDEGYGYWWNGACRALEALDLLACVTDGTLDGSGAPSLRATVAFPHRMHLGGDWYVSFADSQARPTADQPWHALHRAARRAGDADALAFAAAHRRPGEPAADELQGLGRLLRGITDTEWVGAGRGAPPLPRVTWFPSTQVLLARPRAGSTAGLTLAVKGGHNGENHNHNDVGSLIVAAHGLPVIIDAGRPTYTAATFGPDRYAIWTMQSTWHSVPELRGLAQATGEGCAARHVRVFEGDEPGLELDLAGAYPDSGIDAWTRRVSLDRDGRVRLTDRWQGASAVDPAPSTSRLLLAGRVELGDGQARVTPLDGAPALTLRWSPTAPATLTVRDLDDPMLSQVWGPRVTRLDIDVTTLETLQLTVELDAHTTGGPA